MEEKNKSLIFIGLPETGKTSYIAALWSYFKANNETDDLLLDCLPDQREYIEGIATKWRHCETLTRNTTGSYEKIEFSIKTKDNNSYKIEFPDLAGEMFKHQFEHRELTKSFISMTNSTNGAILFINPNILLEISSHNQFGDVGSPQIQTKQDLIPYDIEKAPQRIKIVDLMQILMNQVNKNIKLAVIISAWDSMTEDVSPQVWIESNLPFISTFIKHNFKEYHYFGVSAQGGDYESQKDELLNNNDPLKRIIVNDCGVITNNITKPLKWLMEE